MFAENIMIPVSDSLRSTDRRRSLAVSACFALAQADEPDSAEPKVGVCVEVTDEAPESNRRKKRQPRYHVILWDDDEHTYDYVIRMMCELFGYSKPRAFELACKVDRDGRVICLTTTLEHAELKKDQIHAFGKDAQFAKCAGSMTSTIEPVPE